jgi:hypothetical protein
MQTHFLGGLVAREQQVLFHAGFPLFTLR